MVYYIDIFIVFKPVSEIILDLICVVNELILSTCRDHDLVQ